MEREQKQELGWRVSVLTIPAFHCTLCTCNTMAHSGGMQEWLIQIPSIPILVSVLFPSLHLKYFRIKFLLLVLILRSTRCFKHAVSLEDHQTRLDFYVNGSRIRKQHYKEGSYTANRQREVKTTACAITTTKLY